MANLKTGSSGSEVKKLQKALVDAGYSVGNAGVDGIFGSATAAAVKKYQKDNGLAVDGIAGKNTLGSLYGTSTTAAAKTTTTTKTNTKTNTSTNNAAKTTGTKADTKADTKASDTSANTAKNYATSIGSPVEMEPFTYQDFTYADYTPSDVVQQANTVLQQHRENQPGAYQSQWQDEINDYLNQIQNRDPFSYDFNSDALYQQYKDSYIQQGQMAMMDTMGQAAAMTGGYGNSYAQTVGQQAYNQQLSQLNNIMPELYQMAHDRYAYEGQQLQDNLNMYMGLEDQDYSRYQADLGNWYTQLEYLTNQYNNERELDYNKYQAGREEAYSEYLTDKDVAYKEYATEQDRAWQEYLTDQEIKREQEKEEKAKQEALEKEAKEKDLAAAEIMASAGDYSRLAAIYGLSEAEVKKMYAANAPKATGGGSSKKYTTLTVGSDAYNTITSEIKRAGSVDDLASLAQTYAALGYDPAIINSLTSSKYNSLSAGNKSVSTTVPATSTNKNTGTTKASSAKNQTTYKSKLNEEIYNLTY